MLNINVTALIFLLSVYFGYRLLYLYALTAPGWTVRENVIDSYRRQWVYAIARDKNGILAIQTIRNLEMLNTFLISLTMLIMGGIISVFSANLNWMQLLETGEYIRFLEEHPAAIKLIITLAFILESFFNFIFALRIQFNMNFTVSMAAEPGSNPDFLVSQALRQARHFILGIRSLYFSVAPLVWLISPWAMAIVLIILTMSLFRFDFLSRKESV